MKEVALVFITQLLLTAGSIVAAGLFIRGCKRLFVRACGRYAPYIVNGSGIIGTPVHELSHAVMCILFRHKIKRIKLFGISNNTLGFVEHSYNPVSLWQRIGNFFIGIAPVLAGSGVLLLLLRLFLPDACNEIAALLLQTAQQGTVSADTLMALGETVASIFGIVFSPENCSSWRLWVFLPIALTIAVHMDLSTADIKGGANGFFFFAVAVLLIDIALFFINPAWLTAFTQLVIRGGFFLTSLLLLSVVFAGSVGILSLLVIAVRKIFGR